MKKCFYCNTKSEMPEIITFENESITICGDECSAKTISFIQFAERTKVFFVIGIVVSIVMTFGTIFAVFSELVGLVLLCAGWSLLGLTICVFPLATPQTFQLLGIKKTVKLTRVIGVLIIATTPLWPMFL